MKINHIALLLICMNLLTYTIVYGQNQLNSKSQQADSLFTHKMWDKAALSYSKIYHQLSSNSTEKGEVARKIGEAYFNAGDFVKSEVWYKKSVSFYQDVKNWDAYYDVQSALARTIANNGRYDEAIQLSEKIIKWRSDRKDTVKWINENYNYAYYYYNEGNIQKAIKLYNRTIELAKDKDEYTQSMAYNELGNIWAIDLNNEKKALEYYMKSLNLKLKIGVSDKSVSISYNNIGISHKNLGNMDSALHYYNLGLKYAEQSGLPNLKINPLINIANLQKKRGNYEAAILTFNKLVEMQDVTSTQQKINLFTNLGIVYNELKNYNKALGYLTNAEELTEETGNLIDKADIQTEKIRAFLGLNDFKLAFFAQEKLMTLKDSIHNRESEDELADLLLKYETAEKNKTIADQNLLLSQKESALAKRNSWIIAITMFCLIAIITTLWISYRKRINAKTEEEQKVNRAIFESEQKERIRIARDLHDSIGQKLSGIKMLLSKSDENNEDLKKISIYLDETATEVRNISHNLVPEILNFGFIKALENLTEQISDSKKVEAKLNVDNHANVLSLPRQTEVSLYRIVQEILSNILRHSQTEKIFVNVMAKEGFLQILIEDQGVGFDTKLLDNSDGLGWKNILARIKLVNGQIDIKSHTNRGSEFLINIPVL